MGGCLACLDPAWIWVLTRAAHSLRCETLLPPTTQVIPANGRAKFPLTLVANDIRTFTEKVRVQGQTASDGGFEPPIRGEACSAWSLGATHLSSSCAKTSPCI